MFAGYRLTARLCCAAAFALLAPSLAACGGASTPASTSSATRNATSVQSASAQAAGTGATSGATADSGSPHLQGAAGRDTVSRGNPVRRPSRGTGGDEINDDNPGRADSGNGSATGPDPCKLVTRAQAQAILGAPIAAPTEAPLGPTCIYESRGRGQQITLDIEVLDFVKIRSKIHDTIRAVVANRVAYCGRYGRPTTFVPLAHGQVLNIAAPCAIGMRFAETAVRQLGNTL